MSRISLKINIAALAVALVVSVTILMSLPVKAQIESSDATFNEAIQAVKNKDFRHAAKLFLIQAENDQHDAQYNLALLLEAGKGTPQNFAKALTWAWSAQLGGIEAAEELAEDLFDNIPQKSIEEVREAVRARLEARIKAGSPDAVSQFATFHLQLLEEPDYETAYIWFSISVALGIEGALEARDDARDNVDDEKIIDLQSEAGMIYESLNISLN